MAKPSLILLHGALGSKAQFEPWLPTLSQQFEIHLLNLEGHGDQPFADRPFAIPFFADALKDFILQNGLAPARIFGYSMGGYVAMYLAQRKPELVDRIFTFATKLAWNPESAAAEARKLNPDVILEKVPHFAKMLEARHHGNDWREHLTRTAAMMVQLGERPALKDDDFAEIQVPVRMAVGDRDTMVSIEETVAAYRKLPKGQLYVMPGTQHPIEKMDITVICREIVDFLGG